MARDILARSMVMLAATIVFDAGCWGHVQESSYAEAEPPVVFTDAPTLVEIDAGVWVVRDYDQPVYYVNDDYWAFHEGVWFRSHSYQGGWSRTEATAVPANIARRDHSHYIRYHGDATAQVRVVPREPMRAGPEHEANRPVREEKQPRPQERAPEPRQPPREQAAEQRPHEAREKEQPSEQRPHEAREKEQPSEQRPHEAREKEQPSEQRPHEAREKEQPSEQRPHEARPHQERGRSRDEKPRHEEQKGAPNAVEPSNSRE